MKSRLPSWLIAFGIFVVCLPPAWWLTQKLHVLPYYSWALTATTIAAIFFARQYIRQFRNEQNGTFKISPKLSAWSKISIVVGAILALSSFVWLVVAFPHVSNTVPGALELFGPSFLFLFGGAGLVLFGAIVWFLGRRE